MRVSRLLLAAPLALALAVSAMAPAEATYPGGVGRIAFGMTVTGNPDIYSVRADGSGLRQLTDDPGFDAFAAYDAPARRSPSAAIGPAPAPSRSGPSAPTAPMSTS